MKDLGKFGRFCFLLACFPLFVCRYKPENLYFASRCAFEEGI